jgi:hypothetical protein
MCVVIALDFLRALKRSADQVFIPIWIWVRKRKKRRRDKEEEEEEPYGVNSFALHQSQIYNSLFNDLTQ